MTDAVIEAWPDEMSSQVKDTDEGVEKSACDSNENENP